MPFTPRVSAALALCALVAAQPLRPALADEAGAAPAPPEVTVEVARSSSLPLSLEYSARAAGYREVEVRAQVSGILQKRTYEEGRPVKQGQVLFQIDPRPYQAALGQAKGALAQAQARYRQTDRDLKRIRELQRKGFASASELDRYTSDYEQAKADVEAARANVDAKQIDLDYTTVKAPISGMASKETRSEGSLVTASDPNTSLLTELTQLDPIYVNFAYSDTEAARLRDGVQQGRLVLPEHGKLNAQVFFGDGSRYPIDGVVDFTDSFVNTGTGTINARAVVPNPDTHLIPGQFVRVVISGITRKAAVTVPERALAQGPRGTFVYVVDKDGFARVRQVSASQVVNQRWVIDSGVDDGDRVIVDGLPKVRPDQPVKAVEAPAAPAQQAPAAQAQS
ncbi:membrane fusion protein, multidrug efflux system [Pseudomonas delhiensis]|uniref:Membrane fusion protein, multidrug efflux system n=1 Tax=Pseudomonas delhiensis TaxID=366289 RepID=A0A239E0E4_9PSED|nr:efflux RND transporter periplasmic adaptor subunit [Pseudomonas delhiensis]SDI37732.1 membrane fusion protein, multidrug efflux system [Pseudomonas delhiensis]SNS38185.1 membrane fusion protein, multidrug efflux system [Pseudomonas delhiensis]